MKHKNSLKVAITGANGFVGKNVGKALAKKGISVVGIIRKGKGSSIIFGDVVTSEDLSEDYLTSKLYGCSALLHFIGKGKQTVDSDYQKVNVGITKNVIKLCKKAKIKKIIYISGLGVSKDTTFGYFISKFQAEQEIINSGLDYTIFRASYIIGKDDSLSNFLFKQMKKGKMMVPGSGRYRLQPIFVGDVAEVVFQSITQKKFSNKIIDLVGPKMVTFNDYIRDFLQGKKIPIKNINLENAYHAALNNPKTDFGIDDLNILIGDYVGNHKKLKSMSRIEFKTYKDVLETCCLS
jgi:nucleoside-diphosphate-sugar epimerase